MSTLVPFLVFCQALGALAGAFSAVWSEMAYVKAMRDGRIDQAEREHLNVITHGLRFGMTLLLLASLCLIIVAFINHNTFQPALSPSYWILITLSLLVVTVSWALAQKRISFKLGSASLFTAWWFLVYLSLGWIPLSFGSALMSFIVVTAIFYAILQYIRFFSKA